MAARQSPWMNDRAHLLIRLLRERYAMTISEEAAREDISSHVDLIAERMRVGRQTAKMYITDDVIERLAEFIARTVNQHHAEEAPSPPRPPHLRVVHPGDSGDHPDDNA